MSSYVVPS